LADEEGVYQERHWRGVFQVLDKNNSGKLDKDDLMELFPGNAEDELREMLTEYPSGLTEDSFAAMMEG